MWVKDAACFPLFTKSVSHVRLQTGYKDILGTAPSLRELRAFSLQDLGPWAIV